MPEEKTFGIIFTNPKIPILDYKTNDVEIQIGSLVEVPLGNRIVLGVVWEYGSPEFEPEDLKSILRVVGSFGPIFLRSGGSGGTLGRSFQIGVGVVNKFDIDVETQNEWPRMNGNGCQRGSRNGSKRCKNSFNKSNCFC